MHDETVWFVDHHDVRILIQDRDGDVLGNHIDCGGLRERDLDRLTSRYAHGRLARDGRINANVTALHEAGKKAATPLREQCAQGLVESGPGRVSGYKGVANID